MKTRVGKSTIQLWLLLLLAISVVVVATSIAPSTAHARTRLENTTPLMGDPTDTEDGPQTTVAKSASVSKTSTLNASGDSSAGRRQSWYKQLRVLLALAAGHLNLVRRI